MRKLNFICCLLSVIVFGSCSSNTCESRIPYISNGRIYFDDFSLRSEGRTIIRCEENMSDAGTIETDSIIFSYQDQVGMSENTFKLMHVQVGDMFNNGMVTKKDTILGYLIVEAFFRGSGKETAILHVAALDKIPAEQTLYNRGYAVVISTEFHRKQEKLKIDVFFDSLEIED